MNKAVDVPKTRRTLTGLPPDLKSAFAAERLAYRRHMTPDEILSLKGVASIAFATDISRDLVENIMHYCLHVERRMSGRAAGNIEDLVLRYLLRLIASFETEPDDTELCHMEIGAFFGASTILSCHAVQLAQRRHRIVVIDPFAGYYEQPLDPLSNSAVTEETFWANLERFGFDGRQVSAFNGMSTDAAIIGQCARLKLLSLIIDGDHSYDGVKRDWIHYAHLVVPGGYVLVDDYNNVNWPDVTRFVNSEILPYVAGKWSPLLVFGHTIILKRLEPAGGETFAETLIHRLKDGERTIAKQAKQMEILERRVRYFQNSMSWRVTGPLRWLRRKLLRFL